MEYTDLKERLFMFKKEAEDLKLMFDTGLIQPSCETNFIIEEVVRFLNETPRHEEIKPL
ncbi:hypothetical protein AB6Q85_003301 [Vibrio cholerae]